MNDQVDGIIIRHTDYKDNALILTVLTREFGKISLIAQGAKKQNSKIGSSTFLYSYVKFLFDYKEGKTMFRMKNAQTVSLFRFMHENLNASIAASVISELADRFLAEQDPGMSETMFDLVYGAYDALNQQKSADLVTAVFVAKLLNANGIGPQVDNCIRCSKTNINSISVKEGGFLCPECSMLLRSRTYPVEDLRAFRLINKASFENIDAIQPYCINTMKLLTILVEFIRIHAGVELKSYELFARLFQID